jgi:transcription regulator MmyB-like protein
MPSVSAYGAPSVKAPLERMTIERRPVGPHDVHIDIKYSGVCHSDVFQTQDGWGRNPDDPQLWALVDELGSGSAVFRDMWASQDVKDSAYGRKKLRHPDVGEFELLFESVRLPADPEWSLISLHAPRGSHSERAVRSLLAHSDSLIASR